jgi:hypothetical protein
MGELDEHGAGRRLKAAEEAARVLKPFGGDGAKKAHEVVEALRKGGAVDARSVKAVEAALLDALMDTKVKSKVTPKKSAFLHLLVAEKPARPEIRAAYKEFEAAFSKPGVDAFKA